MRMRDEGGEWDGGCSGIQGSMVQRSRILGGNAESGQKYCSVRLAVTDMIKANTANHLAGRNI